MNESLVEPSSNVSGRRKQMLRLFIVILGALSLGGCVTPSMMVGNLALGFTIFASIIVFVVTFLYGPSDRTPMLWGVIRYYFMISVMLAAIPLMNLALAFEQTGKRIRFIPLGASIGAGTIITAIIAFGWWISPDVFARGMSSAFLLSGFLIAFVIYLGNDILLIHAEDVSHEADQVVENHPWAAPYLEIGEGLSRRSVGAVIGQEGAYFSFLISPFVVAYAFPYVGLKPDHTLANYLATGAIMFAVACAAIVFFSAMIGQKNFKLPDDVSISVEGLTAIYGSLYRVREFYLLHGVHTICVAGVAVSGVAVAFMSGLSTFAVFSFVFGACLTAVALLCFLPFALNQFTEHAMIRTRIREAAPHLSARDINQQLASVTQNSPVIPVKNVARAVGTCFATSLFGAVADFYVTTAQAGIGG